MTEKRVTVWVQSFRDRPNLVLQWHDPDTGQRRSETAGTADPGKAEQARADKEYELNHGLHKDRARTAWPRFRERFEEEYVAPLRPCTRDNYEDALDLFERLCNPRRLDLITVRTVSAFAAGMRSLKVRGRTGMAPSTVKVRLQFLHTALSWAAEQGMLARVPKFPRVKVPERKPQPVSPEAFERLLARAADPQLRAYLLCGWLAGLRLSEAYHLEWEPTDKAPWVDLARNRIWLPAEACKGTRDQWVPLDPQLREALEALPRHGKRVFRFVDGRRGKGGLVSASAMSDRVARLAARAGVRLTMHTLRKGFGCRYAGKVPAQVLQKLMRHRNIKTTMDYYANVDAAVEEAVLGPQRNGSRNSAAQPAEGLSGAENETLSPEGPSGNS
jgi:integrase